jgi:hypothetical protein
MGVKASMDQNGSDRKKERLFTKKEELAVRASLMNVGKEETAPGLRSHLLLPP